MDKEFTYSLCKRFWICLIYCLLAATKSYAQESIQSIEESYNQRIANIEKRLAELRGRYENFKQEMKYFNYESEEKKNEATKTDFYYRSSINDLENELNATRLQKEEAIEAKRKADRLEKILKQRALNARRQKEQQMQIEVQKKKEIERARRQAMIDEQRRQQKALMEAKKRARDEAKENFKQQFLEEKNGVYQTWHNNIDNQNKMMENMEDVNLNNHKEKYGLGEAKPVTINESTSSLPKGGKKETLKADRLKKILGDNTELARGQVNERDYY